MCFGQLFAVSVNEIPMAKFSISNEKLEVPKIVSDSKSKQNINLKNKSEINENKIVLVNPMPTNDKA